MESWWNPYSGSSWSTPNKQLKADVSCCRRSEVLPLVHPVQPLQHQVLAAVLKAGYQVMPSLHVQDQPPRGLSQNEIIFQLEYHSLWGVAMQFKNPVHSLYVSFWIHCPFAKSGSTNVEKIHLTGSNVSASPVRSIIWAWRERGT